MRIGLRLEEERLISGDFDLSSAIKSDEALQAILKTNQFSYRIVKLVTYQVGLSLRLPSW